VTRVADARYARGDSVQNGGCSRHSRAALLVVDVLAVNDKKRLILLNMGSTLDGLPFCVCVCADVRYSWALAGLSTDCIAHAPRFLPLASLSKGAMSTHQADARAAPAMATALALIRLATTARMITEAIMMAASSKAAPREGSSSSSDGGGQPSNFCF